MNGTTTAEVSELDLTRLQRRALAAAQLAGCNPAPEYVASLTREQLHVLLDGMDAQ